MASSSSGTGTGKLVVGANGSSNTIKKVIRVSLDTSDTINLNHLDVLPMQLVETLDRNIEEVNVKLKTPENKKPNDSSDANNNPNETYACNRDRAPCGNVNLNLYSTCSDIITQNQKLQLLKNPNNNPNKTNFSSSSKKKRNSDHNNNNCHYSTLSRENMTNARLTTTTRKYKSKVVNASPSFDRFGRMTRITTNFAENSETSVSECQVRLDKKKRQPVRVNLADILPLSDSLSISDAGNNGTSNRASEESWSAGVPETVQKDIVKKIMDLGLDLKSGIKSSHALRKLQEALQDLQNDWQSDFTRSSPTIPNPPTENRDRDRARDRNRRNEQEAEFISEDSQSGSGSADSSDCLSLGRPFTNANANTTKNTNKENKQKHFNISSEDYKPPVAVAVPAAAMNQNQLQKSQQVLTLCPNRADLFTCHSSDCSVSDFLVTETSVTPRPIREPPLSLSPTSSPSRIQEIQEIKQKLLSLKPIADYQHQPQDQGQGQRSLTPQSEAPAEPKLSPEKVAAIWNWVSPKYDQVSQQDFDLQIEVIRRKKEKLFKTALFAGEKQKQGKSTPTATPKKGSKTNNKHTNNSNNVGSKKIKLKPVNSNKKKIIQSQSQRTTAVTIKKIKSKIMKLKPLLTSINLLKANTNADVAIPHKPHHHHHHHHPTPTTPTAPNSQCSKQLLYVPSRPSTPSLTLEYRDRDDIFDGEDYYADIQNENDSIQVNNNEHDHHHGHYDMYSPRDCHLFLSDPITQNVFSRVSFQDGSFSQDGDILPSRPFRGGPDHMDTGHLDSYVSQVLSSVNLQEQEDIVNANINTYDNQSIVGQYEMDETNEHEPGQELKELGPVFQDKDNNDDEVNEIEVDSVLERIVMTPPCISNWNLSPLYEAIATTGNNFVNLHESILNIKSEVFKDSIEDLISSGDVGDDDCRCEDCDCDPQLHLDASLKKDVYRNRNYEELTIMEQLELLEDGNGSETGTGTGASLTEWNSECECCSMSMSPLLFSADLYGSMADVHSGDEIATRCSTSSSITEFEHQGVECVSNTNVMMQVRKLSSIRNKLRLLDLLKETVAGTATGKKAEKDGHGEQMRTNSKDSKVDLLMTSLPLTTPTHAGSSAPAENGNYSENPAMVDANADTPLNLTNLVQLQCPAAPAPDCPADYKKTQQKQKLRLPFPFELNPTTTVDEESMMKQFYFLPLPPTDPIKIELTFRKSYDSMKAQPPSSAASSPSVTARFRLEPPTPTAPAFITDVNDTLRINRNEDLPKKPKTTRNSDQHQNQPAPSKQNSAHALQQTTKKLSGESLSKKSRKKKTRKKNHDDLTEETGTGNCETDTVKEKKHRKHRRHHEDGGADLKCDEDAQQSHKKRSSTKKDRSHIEKLKSILPRTPGGRYTLRGKEAEDAIADYVKAELATSLGIGFGFHGQGQGQEGHLETMANLPISESKAKILEAGCLHDLVRSVTSSLVDNQDKKGKEMLDGPNKIQQQQQQVLVNNSKPKPRSKKHMDNSISGISKLLSGSKSLKILNLSKNNTHSHSNPYMAHHQTYQRVIASTAAARKRMSVGVIPKQSTRPNFLRYQQQSIAAMINISKARASHYVKGYGSTGSKYFVSSGPGPGAGAGLGRLTNNGIGPPIFGTGSGSGSGGGGSNSPTYSYNHNCSPARSNISNSTYQQYQRLPPHNPNSLSHVRLKTNRRNAVTVVFDSTATGNNTASHRE